MQRVGAKLQELIIVGARSFVVGRMAPSRAADQAYARPPARHKQTMAANGVERNNLSFFCSKRTSLARTPKIKPHRDSQEQKMSHEGHDHAAELAAGAGAAAGQDHSFPPGVVALSGAELAEACALAAAEDPRGALDLRIAAIFVIAIGSALGMFLPLLLQRWRAFDRKKAPFFVLKAFGAGVILATGIVHMYPAANSALSSPCLGWPEFPW